MGIRISRPFVRADACIGPQTGTPGVPVGGGLYPAPSGAAAIPNKTFYSEDGVLYDRETGEAVLGTGE